MKLTTKQKEVIRLMRDGWTLHYGKRINRQRIAFLSKEKETPINVNANTAYFLVRNNAVETVEEMPFIGCIEYTLSKTIEQ